MELPRHCKQYHTTSKNKFTISKSTGKCWFAISIFYGRLHRWNTVLCVIALQPDLLHGWWRKCCAYVTHFSGAGKTVCGSVRKVLKPAHNRQVKHIALELQVYNVINIIRTRRALHNSPINSLRPRQNGRHFADAILKCISLIENVGIPIKISPKFVPKGPINNFPALVQIMAWRRSGDKPLSEPMAC